MSFVKYFNRIAGLGLSLGVLAGCHNDGTSAKALPNQHAEDFAPDDSTRASRRILEAQTVAGARADTTLYSAHFDGPMLSTLGTHKLDLVLRDTHSMNPLVVYISVTDDGYAAEHRNVVANYLADRGGLRSDQIKFETGPQPDTYEPSKPAIDALAALNASAGSGTTPAAPPAAH